MRAVRPLLVLLLAGTLPLGGCDVFDDDDDSITPPPEGPTDPDPADPAGATIRPVVNVATDLANDLRGLTFAADGKIYASGHVGVDDALLQTVVARFNADGSFDTAFGGDGVVAVDLAPGRQEESLAVAELANGDVLVAVNAVDADGGESVYLLRFDDAGTQLTSPEWGDADGKVEVVFGWANADNASFAGATPPSDTAWDMQVDSGGGERVVIFGLGSAAEGSGRTDTDRFVVRLDAADGTVDPAFNGGEAFTWHSTGDLGDNARRGLVESDGSIVSAGYTDFGDGIFNHVILIRLTPDGEPDANFGNFIEPADTAADVGIDPQPGVAVFNPFKVDGGFAECYAVGRQSTGSYVTTGYGAATGDGIDSTLGYETTLAQDLVAFRTDGSAVDTVWGNDGTQAMQSEGQGRPSDEERGRHLVVLGDDRTVHVGRYGGNAAAYVFTADGQADTNEDADGIIELGHPSIGAQFFNAVLSSDGSRIAMTTNADENGARLVVLEVDET